jgi:DNA-binding transcriptional ArsR family regulator
MSLLAQKGTLELLSNPTRLQILRALQERGGKMKVSELAAMLVPSSGSPEVDEKARRRLVPILRRTHLPIMERLGLIQYDFDSRSVILRELPAPLATELESVLLLLFDLLRTKQA